MKMLFTRPAYDDVTAYLHIYAGQLVDFARTKGFTCLDKEKEHATRSVIESAIKKNNPKFIMFNGHGSADCICGHNNEILIKCGENHTLLKSKIVYALACSSAQNLGPTSVDAGTVAFIGYEEEFALGIDVNSFSKPSLDMRAKLFLNPSNLLVESLIKGNSAEESVKRAKELIKKNISFLKTDTSPDAKDYIPYLYNNYHILKICGEAKASLTGV